MKMNITASAHASGVFPEMNTYVVPRPYSSPGVVQRISMKGLDFLYVESGECNPEPSTVDILIPGISRGTYLDNLPVVEVSDVPVTIGSRPAAARMKRRCVQFGDLTTTQASKLAHFISYHTKPGDLQTGD